MTIQFPLFLPQLQELVKIEPQELAKKGFSFFDIRSVTTEHKYSLQNHFIGSITHSLQYYCIRTITHSKKIMTSDELHLLPKHLLKQIQIHCLSTRVLLATQEVLPWQNSKCTITYENSVLHFINTYLFDQYFVAIPTLDISNKKMEVGHGVYTINLSSADFKNDQPILRLMREDGCVGVSFLLKLGNGHKVPWTLMQANENNIHIWHIFQTCALFKNISIKITDLNRAHLQAKKALADVDHLDDTDQIDIDNEKISQHDLVPTALSFMDRMNTVDPLYLLIKKLRQLILGKTLYALSSIEPLTWREPETPLQIHKISLF